MTARERVRREVRVSRRIVQLVKAGVSAPVIASILREEGYVDAYGGPLSPNAVKKRAAKLGVGWRDTPADPVPDEEVARLLDSGLSAEEIATLTGLKVRTVRTKVSSIRRSRRDEVQGR